VLHACGAVCIVLTSGCGTDTQGANNALQTIPFQEQFGGIAEVDYSLVSGPTFGPNYLTLNSKGEFYYLPHKTVTTSPSRPSRCHGTDSDWRCVAGVAVCRAAHAG
jgi:hypothetical protein